MTKKRKHTRAELTLWVFVVLTVFLAAAVINYNQKTNRRVSEEIHGTLESYAQQQAEHVGTVLAGQFNSLNAFASYLGQAGMENTETFLSAANAIRRTQEFDRITMADVNGNGMTDDGIQRNIQDLTEFQEAVKGEQTISEPFLSSVEDGYLCVLLAVPINDPQGEIIGVLCGSYTAEQFGTLFLHDNFKRNDACVLINGQGDVIVASQEGRIVVGDKSLENVFEKTQKESFLDGHSVEDMQQAIQNGEKLVSLIQDGSQEYYVTQTPFGYNGWTLLSAIRRSEVDSAYAFVRSYAVKLNVAFAVYFLFCFLLMFYLFRSERSSLRAQTQKLMEEKEKLEVSEERFRLLARDSDVLVFELNYLEHTLEFNENFEKILGIKPDFRSFLDGKWVYPEDVSAFSRILPQSSSRKGVMTRNIRFCNLDGVYIWFSVLTSIFADDRGRVVRILGKMMNIDESMREKEALKLRAQTDSMTGLYNKMATEELVTHALRKYKNSVCALLIVDMDNLKRINDTLGHTQGDRAIVGFAEALHRTFRSSDIVGRIGGDEFMVFLINVQSSQQLTLILDAIVKKWDFLYTGEKDDYPVHGSIGAALTNSSENFQELYRKADMALYKAKRGEKGGYAVYSPEMEDRD